VGKRLGHFGRKKEKIVMSMLYGFPKLARKEEGDGSVGECDGKV